MNRQEKAAVIDEMRGVFDNAAAIVVTRYRGMTVAEMSDLRGRMREAGAGYKVTKNRLAKRALEGTSYGGLAEAFTGPTAISYSDNPVSAAKAAVEYARQNDKLIIVQGAMGEQMLDADRLRALADLPSLDELRAKLVGLLQAPASQLARVTQAPAGKLARVIGAYAEKGSD